MSVLPLSLSVCSALALTGSRSLVVCVAESGSLGYTNGARIPIFAVATKVLHVSAVTSAQIHIVGGVPCRCGCFPQSRLTSFQRAALNGPHVVRKAHAMERSPAQDLPANGRSLGNHHQLDDSDDHDVNNASLIGEDDVADSTGSGTQARRRPIQQAAAEAADTPASTSSTPPPPTAAAAAAAAAAASNPLEEKPIYQALYDIGCGCAVSLMVGAKIFTYAILVFQASPAVMDLRGNVTNAAAIGVILLTIILMCKSRYPYVVVVPDMFSAPYVITMSFQLVAAIEDPRAARVTVLAMVFFVYALSAVLHILMASFRLLRFAEFLPYPVFCGLFSAVGLTIVQRAIQFAPGYQIIPTLAVATSLSLKIFKTRETRPALTFVSVSVVATALFYGVAAARGMSVDDLRRVEWLVASPVKGEQLSTQLVPWLLWVGGDSPVDLSLIQWTTLVRQCGSSVGLLCVLIALRRSMQLANLNRLFACRAKTNYELALHGYSQLLAVVGLGTFSGVLSGPDMVRIKRMHGGEIFPGIASVVALACITLGRFAGVDYIPKVPPLLAPPFQCPYQPHHPISPVPTPLQFVFMGILANEGIMMLDRFLLMPYRMAGIIEWIAVAAIAVTAFFDIFQGFFLGAAISLVLFSVRFYRIGCVKMTGTGLTIRSTVDRSDAASDWLSSHGEKIRVIQLRGTVAFANVAGVLDVVADMLDMNENKVGTAPPLVMLYPIPSKCACAVRGDAGRERIDDISNTLPPPPTLPCIGTHAISRRPINVDSLPRSDRTTPRRASSAGGSPSCVPACGRNGGPCGQKTARRCTTPPGAAATPRTTARTGGHAHAYPPGQGRSRRHHGRTRLTMTCSRRRHWRRRAAPLRPPAGRGSPWRTCSSRPATKRTWTPVWRKGAGAGGATWNSRGRRRPSARGRRWSRRRRRHPRWHRLRRRRRPRTAPAASRR